MNRPVTLFTGQWADLPLEDLAPKAGGWGFDGLELACWGDHFEVDRALADAGYCRARQRDPGAQRPERAGDRRAPRRAGGVRPDRRAPPGDPAAGGVRRRRAGGRPRPRGGADEGHGAGGRAARGAAGERLHRLVDLAPALLVPAQRLRRDRARRTRTSPSVGGRSWTSSTQEGVKFGLEVHPTEIAYDFVTTRKTLDAIGNREAFGINLDPSHFAHQFLDTAQFALEFARPDLPRPRQGLEEAARRTALDPRLAPQLRRGGARLGLRLARPRRRRLRGLLPGAEPDRLPGAALDRVGGQRHGPRLGRAGRARVRPQDGLLALGDRVRRGDAEGGRRERRRRVPQRSGGTARGESRDRRRHARLRLHGQGARERLPHALLHGLAAAAAAAAGRRSRAGTRQAVADGRGAGTGSSATSPTGASWSATPRSSCSTTAARTTSTPSRRSPPPRPASTSSARSRSDAPPMRATRSGSASPRPASST